MNFDQKNVQQNRDYIVHNYLLLLDVEKHFMMMLFLYQQSLYISGKFLIKEHEK
jgi:hypothetical protein